MNQLYPPELEEYRERHGHICFGLAIGYRAGKFARQEFGLTGQKNNEEMVIWLQKGGCSQEAIELIFPCTCQDGETIRSTGGKYVFVFFQRSQGRAVRLVAKPNVLEACKRIDVLKTRIKNKTASQGEISRFHEINEREVDRIFKSSDEELFYTERFDMALLVKLNPYEAVYVPKASCTCPEEMEAIGNKSRFPA